MSIQKTKVSIIGLGFVGSAMSVAIASAKNKSGKPIFKVVGIEKNNKKGNDIIKKLNNGIFPIPTNDSEIRNLTKKVFKNKNLKCTSDLKEIKNSKIIIIDINLDLKIKNAYNPDINIRDFSKSIKNILTHICFSTLIIIQTTVPPGTTNNIIKPLIKKHLDKNKLSKIKIRLAYSFERVMPGKFYLRSIIKNWRVIGAENKLISNEAYKFFAKFVDVKKFPIEILESIDAAEFTKILENSYRAVNIAFIEEWSRLAEKMGIDIYKVIDAIKVRETHKNISKPGLGVGGYCLTKDPLFGKIAANKILGFKDLKFPLSTKSILINRSMPLETIKILNKNILNLNRKTIGIFGISYKEDIGDIRYSPTLQIIKYLDKYKIKYHLHDPFFKKYKNINTIKYPDTKLCDVIIFCVAHKEYKKINFSKYLNKYKPVIIDSFNVLTEKQIKLIRNKNIKFLSIGR